MAKTTFIRLLETPIDDKGKRLREEIVSLHNGVSTGDVFVLAPARLMAIPGAPFAYWIPDEVRDVFAEQGVFQAEGRDARVGLSTKDDVRFVRLAWEVPASAVQSHWYHFAKGGPFSPYYFDLHLLVDWENDGERLKQFVDTRGKELFGTGGWSRWINSWDHYFRPGITWSRRSKKGLSFRALPAGCIFSDKGPTAFVVQDNTDDLLALLGIMNSVPFQTLVEMQMAFGSYEVGVIQRTPWPRTWIEAKSEISRLSGMAFELSRKPALSDETTAFFSLPALADLGSAGLAECLEARERLEVERLSTLADVQAQIDAIVAVLYGFRTSAAVSDAAIAFRAREQVADASENSFTDDGDQTDEELIPALRPRDIVADMLTWCVGVALGRWDVRYALRPETLPPPPGPFDRALASSPGMLKGQQGLPLLDPPGAYPLPIAFRGFLVDDPDRPQDDIVAAVRRVLSLLWGDKAESMENEACQNLEVADLRSWFRDPRGFFAWHIRRYSKSRRKAPIYWFLQSAQRNYAIWLYYPRLNNDSLYVAAREYADAKLRLESTRLKELQAAVTSLTGASRKIQERNLAAQAALVEEITFFLKTIEEAAKLDIQPDLNDGVLLNIAPLRRLVPWKEAERTWNELLQGKYKWSHVSARLRAQGLVEGA